MEGKIVKGETEFSSFSEDEVGMGEAGVRWLWSVMWL